MFNFNEIFEEKAVESLSSITLAFVGDAVYTLFIRQQIVSKNDYKSGELNKIASSKVCATAQSKLIEAWLPLLNEKELAVYKRARNTKKPSHAKNASISDYNKSTGFEAVIGYLYLLGEYERLNYLLNVSK